MKKILITAISKNNVIGNNDSLPWNKDEFKEDLQYFKENTLNYPIIYGYNTFKSLNYKPLPNRLNIIITSKILNISNYSNVIICNNISNVFNYVDNNIYDKLFIIGGTQIYKYFLDNNLVDELYVTEINKDYEGDTYFPEYVKSLYEEYERIINYNNDNIRFDFVKYKKSIDN